MTSCVLCSIVARDFPTKRLSETTKPCWKRQSFAGNDKALSETTKLCRKRQRLVGNFILSIKKHPQKHTMNLHALSDVKRQPHACRPLSFMCGTSVHKKSVGWTLQLGLSEKRQSFVGNDKALSETTKLCRKRQSVVGNDKALPKTTKLLFDVSSLHSKNSGTGHCATESP